MSQFPKIGHLNDLIPHIQNNPQIRVKPCETTGHTTVCYMVQDEDTFAGENEAFERECRGITFDENGIISARTMHKFFNVGEREDTQPFNIDWSKATRIMEKRDGSMVTPVLIRGWKDKISNRVKFKTKKSFTTPEAALADEIARKDYGAFMWITNLLEAGLTPTFEVTSPRFPIVVRYEKDELTLLHVREMVSGRYLTEKEIAFLAPPFPVVQNLIDDFKDEHMEMGCFAEDQVSWSKLEEAAKTREGIEGWVVQLENGDMFKIKTKWYIDLHHSVTFIRWRDIARTVCADQADDLKAAFSMVGRDLEPILKVERVIKEKIEAMRKFASSAAMAGKAAGFDAKTMAVCYNSHPCFSQIMRLYRDQEVNWMDVYQKRYLETDWGLEVAV